MAKPKEPIQYPTDAMKQCGATYPDGAGSRSVSVGGHEPFATSRDYNYDTKSGHRWKFLWHAQDGEPQVKKCIRCKYTLYLSQCGDVWTQHPATSDGGYMSVSARFGGYGKA
jgi:hypothetical protein